MAWIEFPDEEDWQEMLDQDERDARGFDEYGDDLVSAYSVGSNESGNLLLSFSGVSLLCKNMITEGILDLNADKVRHYLSNRMVDANETFQLQVGHFDIRPNSTALHVAISTYNESRPGENAPRLAIIRELLRYGMKTVNVQDGRGNSPLHCAAETGFAEAIKVLLESGAEPTLVDRRDGYIPLEIAVYEKNEATVKELLEIEDVDCRKALILAVDSGNVDILRRVCEKSSKEEINHFNDDGMTPLHCAIEGGFFEGFEELIKHGADISARAKDGTNQTCLHMACEVRDLSFVDAVLKQPGSTMLLGRRARVNGSSKSMTPLFVSLLYSYRAQFDLAEKLLEEGSDINAPDSSGNTALHVAASRHQHDVVKFLLERGAQSDIFGCKFQNETALSEATKDVSPYERSQCRQLSTIFELVRYNSAVHGCPNPVCSNLSGKRRSSRLSRKRKHYES